MNGFCSAYTADAAKLSQAFANAGGNQADSLKQLADAYDKFADDAPSAIKPDLKVIAQALHDIANGNYGAISGDESKFATAEEHIATYFSTGCK